MEYSTDLLLGGLGVALGVLASREFYEWKMRKIARTTINCLHQVYDAGKAIGYTPIEHQLSIHAGSYDLGTRISEAKKSCEELELTSRGRISPNGLVRSLGHQTWELEAKEDVKKAMEKLREEQLI
mgnify:CR=1 FL=1|jgi:hypothetical protein